MASRLYTLSVNNNVRLVVTGAGEQVCSLFTLIVGGAEIGVAIAGVNFEAAKPVDQRRGTSLPFCLWRKILSAA